MRICPICGKNLLKGRQRVCDSVICREEMRKSWYEEKMAIPDGYLTASQYAKRMGISPQAVTKKCRAGKIPGAIQDPRSGWWFVPESANVPVRQGISRRKKRIIYATDDEWEKITELAARTKYNTSELLIRKALNKKL